MLLPAQVSLATVLFVTGKHTSGKVASFRNGLLREQAKTVQVFDVLLVLLPERKCTARDIRHGRRLAEKNSAMEMFVGGNDKWKESRRTNN
jgi:hypothetical protein